MIGFCEKCIKFKFKVMRCYVTEDIGQPKERIFCKKCIQELESKGIKVI